MSTNTPPATSTATPLVSIDRLSKRFRLQVGTRAEVIGLSDVSFEIRGSEFLAIVGESGSGKSSLLKCLYRTYDPTSGRIVFESREGEIDLAACSARDVLALRGTEIGYASQFLREIPRVTALDVVARPLIERGISTEEARETARSLLDRLRLPEALWDAYPATFSGGERARVNLARAIAPQPRLLLLDEPTSALDHETREHAITLLSEYLDEGTTVVGVFHERAVVERLADRVAVLDNGALEALLDVEEWADQEGLA